MASRAGASSGAPHIVRLHKAQNHISYALVANSRVYHGVVDDAIGPIDVEILLNEIGAFLIDSVDQFFSFLFTFAASQKTADFVFSWSIE